MQANIKRQKHQTSVENVMSMSAKTVLTNTIPIANQKGNRLDDVFAMKVAFPSFYFFQSFSVTILPVLKSYMLLHGVKNG